MKEAGGESEILRVFIAGNKKTALQAAKKGVKYDSVQTKVEGDHD